MRNLIQIRLCWLRWDLVWIQGWIREVQCHPIPTRTDPKTWWVSIPRGLQPLAGRSHEEPHPDTPVLVGVGSALGSGLDEGGPIPRPVPRTDPGTWRVSILGATQPSHGHSQEEPGPGGLTMVEGWRKTSNKDPSNLPNITCTALPTPPTVGRGQPPLLLTHRTQTLPVTVLQGAEPPAFGVSVPRTSPVVPEV